VKASVSVLYLFVYFIVLALLILVIDAVHQGWVLHTLYREGDIDLAVATLVIGGLVFPTATLVLARLTGSRLPELNDHIRQSAGVYAIIICTAVYVTTQGEQRDSLGYAVAAAACLLGLYAVTLNGLVLWRQRRRAGRVTSIPPSPATSLHADHSH
jgi:uncharacterized membrane protein YvlD (DUF360 family)